VAKRRRNWTFTSAKKRTLIDRKITDQWIDFMKRKADGEQPLLVLLKCPN